jgi:hypothetical protein
MEAAWGQGKFKSCVEKDPEMRYHPQTYSGFVESVPDGAGEGRQVARLKGVTIA